MAQQGQLDVDKVGGGGSFNDIAQDAKQSLGTLTQLVEAKERVTEALQALGRRSTKAQLPKIEEEKSQGTV